MATPKYASRRKSPISITRGGKTTSITGSRSVAAQAIRRGRAKSASVRRAPKAQSGGFDPGQVIRDFFGNVAPQDNLFKQIGNKIKNPGK
jgi:hypothetical protein